MTWRTRLMPDGLIAAAVVGALLCFAVVSSMPPSWSAISSDRLSGMRLGQLQCNDAQNSCCLKGAYTSCQTSLILQCYQSGNLQCLIEQITGTCAAPGCKSVGFKNQLCNLTPANIPVDLCTTTGVKDGTNCPVGEAQCLYNYLQPTKSGKVVNVCICGSGNVCVNGQPPAACG